MDSKAEMIWARAPQDDDIHLYFDCGDAGYVSLTREQAREVVECLETMLDATR